MESTPILRLSGICSLLVVATVLGTLALAASTGHGPRAIDFGDPDVLASLRGDESAVWIARLSLIGPTLALGAGMGWYYLLRGRSALVLPGVLLWYFGMTFILLQDAVEAMMVARLPDLVAAASPEQGQALMMTGRLLGEADRALATWGNMISIPGLIMVSLALLRLRGGWKWLGGLGLFASLVRLALYLLPLPPILFPLQMLAFQLWIAGMGVAMLKGRELAAESRRLPDDTSSQSGITS